MLVLADRRDEVRNFFIKNVLRIFGASAAGRTIERVDWLTIVCGHCAACFHHSLRGERLLTSGAHIDLTRVACADIVVLIFVLTHVAHDVRTCCDGLRFQRFQFGERRRTELVGNNSLQVLLERQFIDNGERVPRISEHFKNAAVALAFELDRHRRRFDVDFVGKRKNHKSSIIELDDHSVLQIFFLHHAVQRRWVDTENGCEPCRTRVVLLNLE